MSLDVEVSEELRSLARDASAHGKDRVTIRRIAKKSDQQALPSGAKK